MKKLKIIRVLLWLTIIIAFVFVIYYLVNFFELVSTNSFATFVLALIFGVYSLFYVLEKQISEKFSFAPEHMIGEIFNYISNKNHGDKREFVRKYDEDVYLNCLNKGIIHQTYGEDGGTYWEFTIYGKNLMTEFNS